MSFRVLFLTFVRHTLRGVAEESVERRLPSVHGLGRSAELLVAVASSQGFTVAAVGQNRFRMALSIRPKWATILAVALAPLAGLGLLLLLVRRTSSLDSVVEEHHKGVEVRIVGAGGAALVAELEPALARDEGSRRPVNAATGSFAPAAPALRSHSGPTAPPMGVPELIREGLPVGARPSQAAVHVPQIAAADVGATLARPGWPSPSVDHAAPAVGLVLPDGRRLTLDRVVVIGRDPVPDASAEASTMCAVSDPSLSKTHAAFGPSGAGAWVVDRHSTNGTTVVAGNGTRPCPPGVRVEVSVGASVLLGDVAVAVVAP